MVTDTAKEKQTNAIEELSFREAMGELERLIASLEANDLELEDSLDTYERGVALVATLKKRLDGAQQRIDVLKGELEAEVDDEITDTTLS